MKQFATIEKLDTGILYLLELASSLSVLLLAFGLIATLFAAELLDFIVEDTVLGLAAFATLDEPACFVGSASVNNKYSDAIF